MNKQSDFSATLIAVSIFCIGLALILVGQAPITYGKIDVSKILVGAGSTIAFIGVIDWLYEVITKKKLHSELVELILGSKSVSDSGIAEFFQDSRDIKFKEAIGESAHLITIFSYNSRFLEDYESQIKDMLRRDGRAEFIFLGRDSLTIDLMKRLGWDTSSMVAHYNKIDRFQERLAEWNDKFKVIFVDAIPRYSVVKTDNSIYLILNTGSHVRQSVPALRVKPNSSLWKFVDGDIDNIKNRK